MKRRCGCVVFKHCVTFGVAAFSAACIADTVTLTAGSSFADGTWSPDKPAVGGAADLAVDIGVPAPWAIVNDLGSGGWFSLAGLNITTGGNLSGDGFDFAANGAMTVSAPTTNAAPLRLNGGATLTTSAYFRQHGEVSGTGDFAIESTSEMEFTQPLSFSGNLHLTKGKVWIGKEATLDAPVVYNNTEGAGAPKALIIRGTSVGRTFTNEFVLGTENTANWSYRLMAYDGKVNLTGPLTANSSKIAAEGTSTMLTISGGVTGNKIVCQPKSGCSVVIDTKPVNLTSEFWFGEAGKVYLNVAGCKFPAMYGFNSSTLVCGGDYFIPEGANFASQNNDWANAALDLNGYSQILGGFTGQGAGKKPFTIKNSDRTKTPTVTIRQASDNTENYLKFAGNLNVIKEGAARLNIAVRVPGDLTIKAGSIYVGAAVDGYFARTLTVEAGGTLNLGGQSVTCKQLVVKAGGRVMNGTITAEKPVLEPGSVSEATIGGDVQKPGAGALEMYPGGSFAGTAAHLRYTVPSDVAVYYPFDGSLAQAMMDEAGVADLVVDQGTPQFVAEGRTGGCLYFDGATVLKPSFFPTGVPTGKEPVTIAAWIKMDAGNASDAGWISFGNKANGEGSSFCIKESYSKIQWYGNNVDLLSGNQVLNDGKWHYIVGTKDATTRRLYLDGIQVGSAIDAERLNVGTDFFLVGKTMHASCFKGWVDDVLVVKRALSAAEVVKLYEDGGVPHVAVPAGKRLTIASGEVGLVRPRGAPAPAVSYTFDSSATWLNDSSGNNETLKVGGGSPAFSSASPCAYGGSLLLSNNNSNNYLAPNGSFPAKVPTGNHSHSLCVFVKADGAQQGRGILGYGNADACQMNSWSVSWSGYTKAQNTWYSGDEAVALSSGNLADGWHSLVETYEQSTNTRKLYLDGVLQVTSTKFTPNVQAANFVIGKSPCDNSFHGNIDEVAVYDTALTAEAVASYHAKGVGRGALPSDVEVVVAAGATLDVGYVEQTLAGLSGGGMVKGTGIVLADGATLVATTANDAPTTVDGQLTIAGGGKVVFPADLVRGNYDFALVGATTLVGAENLADWTFENLPRNMTAELVVKDNVIRCKVYRKGLFVIIK